MKFLIVLVFAQMPMTYSVSPVAGPYDSIDECEARLSRSLQKGETLIRNASGALLKLAPPPVEGVFSQCITALLHNSRLRHDFPFPR
jgi:hypothetical protein